MGTGWYGGSNSPDINSGSGEGLGAAIGHGLRKLGLNGYTEEDEAKLGRLNRVGYESKGFANDARNNYNNLTGRLGGALDDLQAQAQGKNSVSALQLHQALQQNQAIQQSMAAGASPGNATMAARTAAIQGGRLGYGLAGQQAVAGLAERNQAQQNYASLLGQSRGQDAQTALGSYGNAVSAYSGGLNGQQAPTLAGQLGPALGNAASWLVHRNDNKKPGA